MTCFDAIDLDRSSFASKLGTNYVATDDEVEKLTDLLSGPTTELNELEKEMDRVYAQLNELEKRRSELSSKVDAHRALMSPVRRLPVDIIREIFVRCLPTQHNPVMSRHYSPLLLTQVCSGWRQIAHTTPLLWRSIHIAVPCQVSNAHFYQHPSPWEPPESQVSAIDVANKRAEGIVEWLGRSGECPLNIVLYDRDRLTSESAFQVILTAILAFSRRWQTINFQSPSACLTRVVELSEEEVPILRSLTIRGRDPPTNHFHPLQAGALAQPVSDTNFLVGSSLLKAPQLREIVYTRVTEDFLQFPLHWEQLTVISLTGFSWSAPEYVSLRKISQILRRCPSLVKCTMEITHVSSVELPENKSLQPITLPALETISLQCSRTDLSMLFEALEVPALRELEFFIHPVHLMDTVVEDFISFLRRTESTLETLTTDPFFLDKENLHSCLRHCPNLRSLLFRSSHFPGHEGWTPHPQHGLHDDPPVFTLDDDLLHRFIDDTDPLLEKLEYLECSVDSSLTDKALLDFIIAKRSENATAKLQKIAVSLRRPQVLPMVAELKQYVKDGLDCRLSYAPTFTHGPYPATDGLCSHLTHTSYRPWGLLSFDDNDGDTATEIL